MPAKKGVLSVIYSRLRGPIEQAEEVIIKKWICWILKRHVQGNSGRAKTSDANRFVDSALEFARSIIKNEGLDPLKVADDETLFEEKLFFIRLSASVTFLATSLKGLSTLRRKGDASLELDGDWLSLQTQLTTTKIECMSNCTAKFMDLGPNFDLTVDVDAVTVKMKARINTSTMQIIIPRSRWSTSGTWTPSATASSRSTRSWQPSASCSSSAARTASSRCSSSRRSARWKRR
ncbi:uncharacterized protein LOC119096780 isoform X2 [Pollicipes pollicipes]|uniref:uncharacterized protein LOC119096780 isoform X2 n=1 Tax=Pollicipes pollicipes TaxID=41117 RepID=UPI0018856584|nr:uncharacterized protein LOC119096780 isoform X2 [Pollicipes pollicipes]